MFRVHSCRFCCGFIANWIPHWSQWGKHMKSVIKRRIHNTNWHTVDMKSAPQDNSCVVSMWIVKGFLKSNSHCWCCNTDFFFVCKYTKENPQCTRPVRKAPPYNITRVTKSRDDLPDAPPFSSSSKVSTSKSMKCWMQKRLSIWYRSAGQRKANWSGEIGELILSP